jgi:Flp pilus assembly protein TadG
MRSFKSNRIGSRKAQTMVEFALVLPILLVIVYGVLEVGRLILTYSTVISASREAVRYGSATGLNVSGGVPRYNDCAGIRAAAQNVDFLNVFDDANISITYDKGPGTSNYSTCPVGQSTGGPSDTQINTPPLSRIKVTVTFSFTPLAAIVPLNPITRSFSNARTIIGSVQILP